MPRVARGWSLKNSSETDDSSESVHGSLKYVESRDQRPRKGIKVDN